MRPVLAQNRSEDEYTRYELLAPETSSFKIIYDVTAVSPGAKFFFNPIRLGSVATDESVIDLMTGVPLKFQEVSGAEARESGLANASLEGRYIRVELARPVPQGGEGRIRIIKTYKDPKSYYRDGSAHRVRSAARHQAQRRRPSAWLRAGVVQHSFAGDRGVGRPRRHQLHEHLPGPGAARAARQSAREASARRRRPGCRDRAREHAGRSESAAAADGARARVRARLPGSRDRVLPQEPRDARVQPVPRLHRDARRHRQVRQRRARGQHRVGSVGEDPRHRRGAQGRDAEGAGHHRAARSTSAKPCDPSRKSS